MITRAPERGKSTIAEHMDEFDDELDTFIDPTKQQSPIYRAAYEDAEERHEILDKLVKCRHALGLTQTEVARRMGVSQPTVSGFETESSDPRLSTLQRYARAVESVVEFTMDMPADCNWVEPVKQRPSYTAKPATRSGDQYVIVAATALMPSIATPASAVLNRWRSALDAPAAQPVPGVLSATLSRAYVTT